MVENRSCSASWPRVRRNRREAELRPLPVAPGDGLEQLLEAASVTPAVFPEHAQVQRSASMLNGWESGYAEFAEVLRKHQELLN